MNEKATVILDIEEGVARIVFSRPHALNAIDIAMAEAFRCAVEQVAGDASIRVLVLSGAGRAFMAGGDIAEMVSDPTVNADRIIGPVHRAIKVMTDLPIPVIASLHGPVAGAGMSIALAVDLAIAADDVVFQMAYTKIGASPDASGSWHLARLVGLRKAIEIVMLSEPIGAQQALQMGLVNWVVPGGELQSRTADLALRLADAATNACGRSKALLRNAALNALPQHLDAERQAFLEGVRGSEFREGAEAFLQKRRPDFRASLRPGVQESM